MSATRRSSTTTATTTTQTASQSNANTSSSTSSSTPKPAPGVMSGPRKLSARGHSRTLLSRKLSKPAEQSGKAQPQERSQSEHSDGKGKQREADIPTTQEAQEQPPKPLFPVKSIIPDPLAELPSWYSNDAQWAVASAAQFRKKYPIHNPVGPRYYKNHHLAPSLDKRPPSVFSPSFPPMAASTDRLPDTAQVPSPGRSPSSSPLPTPTSSQVRIHDVRVRTRKISQTAHDPVDMLDHTDPWGTNWHHQSPYDVGKNKNSPDSPESPTTPTRPRRASMTNGARHRATVPSPLSQSTSAVHLASEPLHTHAPRRLSKRRKTFRGLFGGSEYENRPVMSRGHSSPMGHADGQALGRKLSHTGSVVQPSLTSSANSLAPTERSSKRSSMLGRLVKRFSVIRRSDASKSAKSSFHSVARSSEYDSAHASAESPVPRRSESPEKTPQPQPKTREATRRVPLPAETSESPTHAQEESQVQDSQDRDDQSLLSVEQRYSMGKLTVANPDDPNSSSESPVRAEPSPVQPYHDVNFPLRTSPEPIEYQPPQPPFYGHPVRAPLSVISEGETYMSSPRMQPSSPKESPVTPPTIPSVLSLPARSAALPMDRPMPPLSPPLPDLPYNPSLPEIPTAASAVSVAAQPMPSKPEPSLPPTPVTSRPPTPPTPPAPSKREPQPEAVRKLAPEPRGEPRADQRVEKGEPKVDAFSRAEGSKTRSLVASNPTPIYQPMASYVDNSPLARASMIVNPPTPYTASVAIPTPTPPPAMPTASPKAESKPSNAESPSSPKEGSRRMRTKHTETFKLVRTASGHVQTVDPSFVADGEHWHVVESPKEERRKSRRDRERSDETEKPEQRKSKRAERESASDESDPQRLQAHARHASTGRGYPDEVGSSQATRRRESPPRESSHREPSHRESSRRESSHRESSQREPTHRESSQREPTHRESSQREPTHREASQRESTHRDSSHRRRSSAQEKRRSSREAQADAGVRSTQTPVIYAPRPHGSSTPTSAATGARLEPRTSVSASTRPSSEFQSVADINALKAKDAWEIERLWKGRSMIYAPDGSTANGNRPHISSDSRPSTIMSHDLHRASTIPSVGGDTVLSTYGSGHTVYTVHSPYQGAHHAATYPQFPASPTAAERQPNAAVQPAARYVQAVELPTLSPIGSSPPRANPLPEPPRLSSYKPSPLPPSLAGSGDGPASPEYWNRYAGVAVTH